MSAMGVKIDQFDVPVCNSFREKVLNGQLCYEVDPNKFIQEEIKEEQLKAGLVFVIDENKDRQMVDDEHGDGEIETRQTLIYLDSIGINI